MHGMSLKTKKIVLGLSNFHIHLHNRVVNATFDNK
jgi:propanediol utilization protein